MILDNLGFSQLKRLMGRTEAPQKKKLHLGRTAWACAWEFQPAFHDGQTDGF